MGFFPSLKLPSVAAWQRSGLSGQSRRATDSTLLASWSCGQRLGIGVLGVCEAHPPASRRPVVLALGHVRRLRLGPAPTPTYPSDKRPGIHQERPALQVLHARGAGADAQAGLAQGTRDPQEGTSPRRGCAREGCLEEVLLQEDWLMGGGLLFK